MDTPRLAPLSCLATAALVLAGCGTAQTPTPPAPALVQTPIDTRAQDEIAVRKASAEWGRMIVQRALDPTLAYYADDAWVSPQGAPIATTTEQRRKLWADFFATPGVADTAGETTRVEVARSGDLAVEYGTFTETLPGKRGARSTVTEKYMTTWRKQPDGSWKVIGDIWNRDH